MTVEDAGRRERAGRRGGAAATRMLARLGVVAAAAALLGAALIAPPAAAQDMPDRETLRRALEARGYSDIVVETIDRSRATVVVCSGGRRERLQVDRTLRARFLDTLGACGIGGVTQPNGGSAETAFDRKFRPIVDDLESMGFEEVAYEDEVKGEIGATACRTDHQYRARYDAETVLLDLYRIGDCPRDLPVAPPPPTTTTDTGVLPPASDLTGREVADRLFREGYRNVFLDGQRGDLYEISGCFGVRRFEMLVDDRAVIQARRAAGFCQLGQSGFEYVPPRPVSQDILRSDVPLDPPLCQQVLNWLQFNRPITFESGSARLDSENSDLVRQMAAGMDRCGAVRVLIEGHTDSVASTGENQALSEARADSVARTLVVNGVPGYAVSAAGFGEDHPISTNDTERGRALNRRIELNLEWGRF